MIMIINITMTPEWARWRLKSPASRLFTQPFIRAQIKENSKLPNSRLQPGSYESWENVLCAIRWPLQTKCVGVGGGGGVGMVVN